MDQFLDEISAYASAAGLSPSTIVQRAGGLGGSHWKRWVAGKSAPNLRTVDRIRAWMAANPVENEAEKQKRGAA